MKKRYIIAIDEGTTSARAGVYDTVEHKLVSISQFPIEQIYPKPGWVEHDATDIWRAVYKSIQDCFVNSGINVEELYGIGITNQRETVVAWDRKTGEPICNAIVWQCRRTATQIDKLTKKQKEFIQQKTGLIPDAYFSASKMEWILKNVPTAKVLAEKGRLCLGTVDSFLIFKLTGKFTTDITNASRTMLFNIFTKEWDDQLLKMYSITREMLPEVVACDARVGKTKIFGKPVTLTGVLGDQQSALFGQCCFKEGMVKNTYGTGCFMLMNAGSKPKVCPDKILTTIGYQIGNKTTYAFEGSVFNAGSIIQWFENEMGIIASAKETNDIADRVGSSNGVYLVPAFTGLGAPYWDSEARAMILGMTRGTNKDHIVRAGLESMAYSTNDILIEMKKTGKDMKEMRCDGGVTKNSFLMQFQASLSSSIIKIPECAESTLMGAIYMCGLSLGVYKNLAEIEKNWHEKKVYKPDPTLEIDKMYKGWQKAVDVARKYK